MLKHFRVAKLVDSGDFDRLLNEVQMNTRQLPLPLRLRLSGEASLEVSAVGLALSRLTELSYRPEPPVEALIARLVGLQNDEGWFAAATTQEHGARAEATITASAIALSALRAVQRQIAALPGSRVGMRFLSGDLEEKLELAVERGLAWLSRRAEEQAEAFAPEAPERFGWAEQDEELESDDRFASREQRPAIRLLGDELDTAVVLWQLGADTRVSAAIGMAELAEAARSAGLAHHRDTAAILQGVLDAQEPRGKPQGHSARMPMTSSVRQAA